jgi:hypothetical protein
MLFCHDPVPLWSCQGEAEDGRAAKDTGGPSSGPSYNPRVDQLGSGQEHVLRMARPRMMGIDWWLVFWTSSQTPFFLLRLRPRFSSQRDAAELYPTLVNSWVIQWEDLTLRDGRGWPRPRSLRSSRSDEWFCIQVILHNPAKKKWFCTQQGCV